MLILWDLKQQFVKLNYRKGIKMYSKLFEEVIKEFDAIETGKEVIKDLRALNSILFRLQENYGLKYKRLKEMSVETDNEISILMDKIARNIGVMSGALGTENQMTPYSKDDMDNVMIGIMLQYATTSACIKLDASMGEIYVEELNRIHSSLNEL